MAVGSRCTPAHQAAGTEGQVSAPSRETPQAPLVCLRQRIKFHRGDSTLQRELPKMVASMLPPWAPRDPDQADATDQ